MAKHKKHKQRADKGRKRGKYAISLKRAINTTIARYKKYPNTALKNLKKAIYKNVGLTEKQKKQMYKEAEKQYIRQFGERKEITVLRRIKEELGDTYFKSLSATQKRLARTYLEFDLSNKNNLSNWAISVYANVFEFGHSIEDFFTATQDFTLEELHDFEQFYNENISGRAQGWFYTFIKYGQWDALKDALDIYREHGSSATSWNMISEWLGTNYDIIT